MSRPTVSTTGYLTLSAGRWRVAGLCLAVLLLVTADVLLGGLLSHLDAMVRSGVQSHTVRSPGWLSAVGQLGSPGFSVGVTAIVAIVVSQASWRWWPLVLAAGAWSVSEALVWLFKAAVSRPGPADQVPDPGYPGYYPSGHVASATVCGAIVCFLVLVGRRPGARAELERHATTSLWTGVGLGLAASVYAVVGDFHWATDCVGGLAIGVLVANIGVAFACRWLSAPARRLEP